MRRGVGLYRSIVMLLAIVGAAVILVAQVAASCIPFDFGTTGNDSIFCDAVNTPQNGIIGGDLGDDTIIVTGDGSQTLVAGDYRHNGIGHTMPIADGGNDTIIINGIVSNSVAGDMVTGNGGDDIIIVNAMLGGEIYGDYVQVGNGGNDRIYINASMNGVYADAVQIGYIGGDDYVELQDGANVALPIDGEGGNDTLAFAFTTTSAEEEAELMALLANASPGGGWIVFRGRTYSWANFERIVRGAAFESVITPSDGRLNPSGSHGAIYVPEGEGIQVYAIDENSQGHLVAYISTDDLAELPDEPQENMLLDISDDGKFAIYKLTTGEYQVNIGPYGDEGKVEVTIWAGIPPTYIIRTEFVISG